MLIGFYWAFRVEDWGPFGLGFWVMGVAENQGYLIWVLIIRILLYSVLYWGPLFSETPILGYGFGVMLGTTIAIRC